MAARDEKSVMSSTLETVRDIWRRTLGVDVVRDEDNFFLLGGDSMLGGIMLLAVAESIEAPLSMAELYDYPSLAGFSRVLADRAGNRGRPGPLI